MASISPTPKQQFFNGGETLSGGKLYTYLSGTTTPYPTYTTAAGDVEHTNPIILDSRGEASIYLDQTVQYRYDLYDANDEPVWDAPIDQINPLPDPIQPSGFYTPDFGPDSDQRSVDNRLQDSVHIRDFTLVCDGATDEWEKFYDALTWCIANNRSLKMYGNCYLGNGPRTWPGAVTGQIVRIWSDGDAIISANGNFVDGLTGTLMNIDFENLAFVCKGASTINDSVFFFGHSGSAIENTRFFNCRFSYVAICSGSGSSSGSNAGNLTVENSTFDKWKFAIFSPQNFVENVRFFGNKFVNGSRGFSLGGINNVSISDNIFSSLTGNAIAAESTSNLTVRGNTFKAIGDGDAAIYAMNFSAGTGYGLRVSDNYIVGDASNPSKYMIAWGAGEATSTGNYCTTSLHNFTSTNSSVFSAGDYGAVSTSNGGTTSTNQIRSRSNYPLDIYSSDATGTELKLRNTSAAGVALMRFQTTTTGFTVNDGSYIANVTGSGDLIIENKEAGFIKVATDGFETLKIGHNGTSDTLQVRSGNATSTELAIRNAGGSAGVALARFQTAFTGYTASDGTVMGNVASSGNFRIDNQEGGSVTIATGGADRVNVSTSSVIVSPPLILTPPSSISLSTNGQMTFELLSNTELVVKVRGSDGTTRTNLLTLS